MSVFLCTSHHNKLPPLCLLYVACIHTKYIRSQLRISAKQKSHNREIYSSFLISRAHPQILKGRENFSVLGCADRRTRNSGRYLVIKAPCFPRKRGASYSHSHESLLKWVRAKDRISPQIETSSRVSAELCRASGAACGKNPRRVAANADGMEKEKRADLSLFHI